MQRENSVLASLILAACMMMPGIVFAQTGEITGTVSDSLSGDPIPGVNVVIAGTSQGAATSAEGAYTISGVEPGSYDLQASFIGYETKLIEGVEVEAGEATEVDIRLTESAVQLQEVVAVAYGTQERQAVTGSVANIDTENLQAMPINSVDEALQGQIAGVSVQSASGIPGGGPAIQVRGTGNVGAGGQPLYVIDGYALPQPGQGSVTRRNPLAETTIT